MEENSPGRGRHRIWETEDPREKRRGKLPEQKEVPGGQSPGSSRKVKGSRREGWD